MQNKNILRKKYFFIRKKKYFEIKPNFFNPLIKLIKRKHRKKKVNLSIYYPASFEVNVLKLFETDIVNRVNILLPVIEEKKHSMCFYNWKKNNVLKINQFGMLEPALLQTSHTIPEFMLIPLLAFDEYNHRLGYGGGFYDRYLKKYLKVHNKITTIGIAFSFQRHHKLPSTSNDVKLDYILTERGMY